MKYLILLLAIFQPSSPLSATIDDKCNTFCECFANKKVTCFPGIEMVLYDDYDYYKSVQVGVTIICQKPHADLSILTGLNITASRYSTVHIIGCTLPNSSLSNLLAGIGVIDFKKMYITSYSGNLQRKHFENLNNVHELNIALSDLGDLPEDIFDGLKNMTVLKLKYSSFKLKKNLFHNNIKLESIHLHGSNISEVRFDVFDNLVHLKSLSIAGASNTSVIFDESKQYFAPSLSYLRLESIEIKTLPIILESTHNQSKLVLVNNTATDLSKQLREFLQSTNIVDLVLTNNTASNFLLQPMCFADLFILRTVDLSANNLTFVPEDAFSKSKKVHDLDISDNLISTFQENTFSDLENLDALHLENNQISHLPEGLFSRTKSLRILYLSHNLLNHIKPRLFSHLPQLKYLDLSHNKIVFISGKQFFHLKSIETIDLSHNQLLSLALDPLLIDLDYSVFYKCTTLRNLYLQNNSLIEIYEDWRLQLTNLKRLNLANNNITDIQTLDITKDTISTETTSNKKITTVNIYEYFQFPFLYDIHVIDISNNTLNCNCNLLTSLYNMSQYFTKDKTLLDNAKCKTQSLSEDVKLIDIMWSAEYEKCKQIPPDEIQKFHQECPEGCRCVYRPFTKSSVINCQNAGLLDYPRTLPVAPDTNHTKLILCGNRLQDFSMPDNPGYKNVTFFNLANNSLSTLYINGASKKLKKLDLSQNQLKNLSEETLEFLEKALGLERLELHGNPWTCDFSNYRLAKFVRQGVKRNLIWHNVTCEDGSSIEKIIDDLESTLGNTITYVVVTILITVFILTVLYYRKRQKVHVYCFSSKWRILRWLVPHPYLDDDSDKLYDAFIVYSGKDEMFVLNHLVPYLEETGDKKYKLCLHFRDWTPGEQILTQINYSVQSSRRTIVVVSPNFLRSVWGVTEFRVAHAQALKDGTARVIVILYEDVSDDDVDEELKTYLQTNTYVRWGSPWFWKQLTYALPHPPGKERAALDYFSFVQTAK